MPKKRIPEQDWTDFVRELLERFPDDIRIEDILDYLVNEKLAAARLDVSTKTLQSWRVSGYGPKAVWLSSRAVRYSIRDLIEFQKSRTFSSTTEAGHADALEVEGSDG